MLRHRAAECVNANGSRSRPSSLKKKGGWEPSAPARCPLPLPPRRRTTAVPPTSCWAAAARQQSCRRQRRGGRRTSDVAAGQASTAFALQPPPLGNPFPSAYQRANISHAPTATPRHRVAALPRAPGRDLFAAAAAPPHRRRAADLVCGGGGAAAIASLPTEWMLTTAPTPSAMAIRPLSLKFDSKSSTLNI